jgi:hypothetical protein
MRTVYQPGVFSQGTTCQPSARPQFALCRCFYGQKAEPLKPAVALHPAIPHDFSPFLLALGFLSVTAHAQFPGTNWEALPDDEAKAARWSREKLADAQSFGGGGMADLSDLSDC